MKISDYVLRTLPRLGPVLRAAIKPTFFPGGAFRETVVGWPGPWCAPPPNGWDTMFIATPRTTGNAL
jgi:hypothetical protein